MAVSVIEYGGYLAGRPMAAGIPAGAPLQVTQFSSAATSTGFLLPATRLVQVFTSAQNAWFLQTLTTSSTITLSTATSTNAVPIAPNTAYTFYAPVNANTIGSAQSPSTSGFRYSILSS